VAGAGLVLAAGVSAAAMVLQDASGDPPVETGEVTNMSGWAAAGRSPGDPLESRAVAIATNRIFGVSMCSSIR
jgi:hypothetical protein